MAAPGLLIHLHRDRGLILEPRRPVRHLTRHDTFIAARAKFYDETGMAIPLTGFTVRYTLKDVRTGTVVINRQTATLENQETSPGEAYYTYTTGQIAHSLDGVESWEVDHGSGVVETFPVGGAQRVCIGEDVDNI